MNNDKLLFFLFSLLLFSLSLSSQFHLYNILFYNSNLYVYIYRIFCFSAILLFSTCGLSTHPSDIFVLKIK